jgi:hypothetical protein
VERKGAIVVESKVQELWEEFRAVFTGRGNLIDTILPPIAFVALNALVSFEVALWGAVGLALIFSVLRLVRRQPVRYALGGLAGVILAVLIAGLVGRAEGFFLPNILSGVGTILLMLISLVARRPLVAWTSYLARRWPRNWYWHPQVRPAYSEVTWLWLVVFVLRVSLQWAVYQRSEPTLLAATNLLTGWPTTIVLLIASYLYGTWRLRVLAGPSVEEFKTGAQPPWTGQRRGF